MVSINNSINNTVGAANSGVTNTLTVTNSSNTASSQALVNINVGGGTAGDAFTTCTVTGVTSWSYGIDNSVSGDPFKISASTALGTTDTLVIDVLGNTTVNSVGANPVTLDVLNSDTGSTSRIAVAVINTSTADPFLMASVNSTANYCWGVDNSDSTKLKICFDANAASATPSGSKQLWVMTTAGERTMPLQPAFLAFLPSTDTNVTGDGTEFFVGTGTAMTEVYDQNSDFNTNGTFTAPVAGKYMFSCGMTVNSVAGVTGMQMRINSTGRSIRFGTPVNTNFTCSVLLDMAVNDTATISVIASGTTKTIGVSGSATPYVTWFSGYLVA